MRSSSTTRRAGSPIATRVNEMELKDELLRIVPLPDTRYVPDVVRRDVLDFPGDLVWSTMGNIVPVTIYDNVEEGVQGVMIMKKITLELSDEACGWVLGFVAMLELKLGEAITLHSSARDGIGTAKVAYHAIMGSDALTAIGEGRVEALIFSKLLTKPYTTVELRHEMPASNNKAIQSALHRLRESGFVESRAIEG